MAAKRGSRRSKRVAQRFGVIEGGLTASPAEPAPEGKTYCATCYRTMPKTKWPSCFSCTFPRREGEDDTAYRKRINTFLAAHTGPHSAPAIS
jgi:hypothetical protein